MALLSIVDVTNLPVAWIANGMINLVADGATNNTKAMNLLMAEIAALDQNTSINERQKITLTGTPLGNKFKLTFDGQTTVDIRDTAKATTNTIQVISLTGTPSNNNFSLTFSGQPTGNIQDTADGAAVQAALEGLNNIESGDVTVTGSAGGPWTAEFKGQYAGVDLALMTADDAAVSIIWGSIKAALVSLSNIGSSDVSVIGVALGPWIVEFTGQYAGDDVALMSSDKMEVSFAVKQTADYAEQNTVTAGVALYFPPGDYHFKDRVDCDLGSSQRYTGGLRVFSGGMLRHYPSGITAIRTLHSARIVSDKVTFGSGTSQSGMLNTQVILGARLGDPVDDPVDDNKHGFYRWRKIEVTGGTGKGQIRYFKDGDDDATIDGASAPFSDAWNGATRVGAITQAWTVQPGSDSTFTIYNGPIWLFRSANGLVLDGINFFGRDPGSTEGLGNRNGRIGLAHGNVTGIASSSWKLTNSSFHTLDIGFDNDSLRYTPDENKNASEIVQDNVLYQLCNVGYRNGHGQGLQHRLQDVQFIQCIQAVEFDDGGNYRADGISLVTTANYLRRNGGGDNSSGFHTRNLKIDAQLPRCRLYNESTNTGFGTATFEGIVHADAVGGQASSIDTISAIVNNSSNFCRIFFEVFYNQFAVNDVIKLTGTGVGALDDKHTITAISDPWLNLVQVVTVSGVVNPFNFQLTFEGQQTTDIAHSAPASTVEARLKDLMNVEDADLTVYGPNGGPWVCHFKGQYAGKYVGLMIATHSDQDATVAVAKSVYFDTNKAFSGSPSAAATWKDYKELFQIRGGQITVRDSMWNASGIYDDGRFALIASTESQNSHLLVQNCRAFVEANVASYVTLTTSGDGVARYRFEHCWEAPGGQAGAPFAVANYNMLLRWLI